MSSADRSKTTGRPPSRWQLTRDGEHLFPKAYADLALVLLEQLADETSRLEDVLGRVIDERVPQWREKIPCDADLETKLRVLAGIYGEGDSYMSVEELEDGRPCLIEHNCPFLDVAIAHPELCTLTVDTLSRVLGRPVEREETFQAGDGRCVFAVTTDP